MIERTMQTMDAPTTRPEEALSGARTEAPTRSQGGQQVDSRREATTDRRTYTVQTLRTCLTGPRRMQARRREDRRFPMLDRFEPGMLVFAVLLVGLSILDSLFTLILLAAGGSEVNPIMNGLLGYGIPVFVGVKMILTAVPAVLLVATGNLRVFGIRARSILGAFVGFYIGLICYELALLSSI